MAALQHICIHILTSVCVLCGTLICYYLTLYSVQLDNSHFKKLTELLGKVEDLNKQAAVPGSTLSFVHLIFWNKTHIAALRKPHICYMVLCSLFGNSVLWLLVEICCTVFAKFPKNYRIFPYSFEWEHIQKRKKVCVIGGRNQSILNLKKLKEV